VLALQRRAEERTASAR